MTADELITNLSLTALVGQKISDLTVAQNKTTLLMLVNMAKNKIAEDTLLWLGGETVTQVTDTYVYELSTSPIQIIDVYDEDMNLRPRNNIDYLGYYQVSPNTLKFNNITNGKDININYYETPPDYILTDTITVPSSLLSAMQFYVAHKAFEIYKSQEDMFSSVEYYKKYKAAIQDYMAKSDSSDVDTVTALENKIYYRGVK